MFPEFPGSMESLMVLAAHFWTVWGHFWFVCRIFLLSQQPQEIWHGKSGNSMPQGWNGYGSKPFKSYDAIFACIWWDEFTNIQNTHCQYFYMNISVGFWSMAKWPGLVWEEKPQKTFIFKDIKNAITCKYNHFHSFPATFSLNQSFDKQLSRIPQWTYRCRKCGAATSGRRMVIAASENYTGYVITI